MKFDFSGMGITLENVKEFESALVEHKKTLREDAKAVSDSKKADAITACNAEIENGTIVKDATVVIMYNRQEVVGTIKNTPSVAAKNLPVSSDAFANKDKFLYVPKQNFVRLA